jgi:hypothetical protein
VLLSAETIKLTFITQNNHVYEYTAESPTPEVSLNVRSPYRRQKRDFSIIRLLFRRSHTRIEILAINIITFLPIISITFYLSPDYIDYFLSSYFLAIIPIICYFLPSYFLAIIPITSTTSYLPTFLRLYRLYPYSLSQSKPRWIYYA